MLKINKRNKKLKIKNKTAGDTQRFYYSRIDNLLIKE